MTDRSVAKLAPHPLALVIRSAYELTAAHQATLGADGVNAKQASAEKRKAVQKVCEAVGHAERRGYRP